jgi:hypothetical protein
MLSELQWNYWVLAKMSGNLYKIFPQYRINGVSLVVLMRNILKTRWNVYFENGFICVVSLCLSVSSRKFALGYHDIAKKIKRETSSGCLRVKPYWVSPSEFRTHLQRVHLYIHNKWYTRFGERFEMESHTRISIRTEILTYTREWMKKLVWS